MGHRLVVCTVNSALNRHPRRSPEITGQSQDPQLYQLKPLPLTRQSFLILHYLLRDGTVSTEIVQISSLSVVLAGETLICVGKAGIQAPRGCL